MEKATRKYLAEVAKKAAQTPFHGYIEGKESNLEPIIRFFPKWMLREADGLWCAAFVYYCCREAGFEIPIRPDACKTCHLAGCIAWEELAQGDVKIGYHKGEEGFVPEAGDIVLYQSSLSAMRYCWEATQASASTSFSSSTESPGSPWPLKSAPC